MKTFPDALKIRERIARVAEDPNVNALRILVGGGGSTGVELASEIQLWLHNLAKIMKVEISIIEGAETILTPFHPKIILRSHKRLMRLGVKIWTSSRIEKVSEDSIRLTNGQELPYDVLIWTGGVAAHELMSRLGMKMDEKSKRVLTGPHMNCLPQDGGIEFLIPIYGIGDAICFNDEKTGHPVPGVARAAIVQANVVSANIIEQIRHQQRLTDHVSLSEYRPTEYPYVIPVGGKYAVAKFGPFIISGFFAWAFKGLIEINYLLSVLPPLRACKTWFRGLWIFTRNDRLG